MLQMLVSTRTTFRGRGRQAQYEVDEVDEAGAGKITGFVLFVCCLLCLLDRLRLVSKSTPTKLKGVRTNAKVYSQFTRVIVIPGEHPLGVFTQKPSLYLFIYCPPVRWCP